MRPLALVLSLLASSSLVVAQEGSVAKDVVDHVMSPFCPGKVLSDCPSPQAAEWRVDVHRWAEEGASESEIMSRLQARVPTFDLARKPPPESTGMVPIAAFLAASLVLAWAIRRLVRRSGAGAAPQQRAADQYDERLDEELARLTD
jgi:cytochrome c-type biogenesis protein CcmH/NrfF